MPEKGEANNMPKPISLVVLARLVSRLYDSMIQAEHPVAQVMGVGYQDYSVALGELENACENLGIMASYLRLILAGEIHEESREAND